MTTDSNTPANTTTDESIIIEENPSTPSKVEVYRDTVVVAPVGSIAETGYHGVAIAGLESIKGQAHSTALARRGMAAITSDEGRAIAGNGSVAVAGKEGYSQCGAYGVAMVGGGEHSLAEAGVDAVAFVHAGTAGGAAMAHTGVAYTYGSGQASVGPPDFVLVGGCGVALARESDTPPEGSKGNATSGIAGISSVSGTGLAKAGESGIAVAWNGGSAEAGVGGVVIFGHSAIPSFPKTTFLPAQPGTPHTLVVGIIGVTMLADGSLLTANTAYKLDANHQIIPA